MVDGSAQQTSQNKKKRSYHCCHLTWESKENDALSLEIILRGHIFPVERVLIVRFDADSGLEGNRGNSVANSDRSGPSWLGWKRIITHGSEETLGLDDRRSSNCEKMSRKDPSTNDRKSRGSKSSQKHRSLICD